MVSQGGSDTISPPIDGLLGGGEENSLLSDQAALLVDQDVRMSVLPLINFIKVDSEFSPHTVSGMGTVLLNVL